jgi:hypothetical protein
MGYIKRWDVNDIKHQLNRCAAELYHNGNDGFTQWDCKKELLEVKYHLEDLLHRAPNFSGVEASYHEDKEKEQVWKRLNEKTNR